MLPKVLAHSFYASVFQIGNTVFRQTQGTLIGFPLSAAICVTAVLEAEMELLQTVTRQRNWCAYRYVDNLITIARTVPGGNSHLPT